MPKPFTLLLAITFMLQGYAQDSLQKQKEYLATVGVFNTEKEKQLFIALPSAKDPDYLAFYLASDSLFATTKAIEEIRSKIDAYVNTPEFAAKQNLKTKELKKVYKDIHDRFLSRYIDNPTFGDLFATGAYNCATASALFALLLDKFSISYNIRETPDHVYIIAAPETSNLLFETTTPGARFFVINDKAKNQYVDYLYNNKLISKEEWANGDKTQLFNKYYYTDELIDKRKLAGLLYYNRGVAAVTGEDYREGYRNFEKAYFLYPEAKIKYFISVCLANIMLEKGMMESATSYPYLLRFTEICNKDLVKNVVLEYMENITKKMLFQNPEPEKYRAVYTTVSSQISDTDVCKELRYNHYYNSAHYYSIKNKFDSSLTYLDSVYALNQNDLNVQELITSTLEEILRPLTNEKTGMDTLKSFFKRYPFINGSGKFGEYYAYCLARVAARSFEDDNKKEGDNYLMEIKGIITKEPELKKKSELYFSNAYVEVYHYYIRHKEYKEAKTFLLAVTKDFPNNEELNRRMQRIDEILANH